MLCRSCLRAANRRKPNSSPCSTAIPGCLQDVVAMVASRLQARMPGLQGTLRQTPQIKFQVN